jgi:hypothetical protein
MKKANFVKENLKVCAVWVGSQRWILSIE